jgi:hypothetical protein
MCRPALFFNNLPISLGFPRKTCLLELKQFVDEGAEDFAKTSVGAGIVSLLLFIMHIGFYFPRFEEEVDKDGSQPQSNSASVQMQELNTEGNDDAIQLDGYQQAA